MIELYALIDPNTNKIRYIGYTTKVKYRLKQHINACLNLREKNCHRCHWINKLNKEGFNPIYKTLAVVDDLEKAKLLEIELIKHYKQFTELTNNTIGGDGTKGLKWTEESKNRIRGRKSGGTKPYKVEALNKITGEYKVFDNKSKAAEYIKCSIDSIIGVSCGQRDSVNKWYVKLIKN